MLKVLAFYSAYTQSANSRRTGRSVVDVFSNFFRSMATWPGPVADTVASWPHACLSAARHKATNAPTDRPPLFETSRSRSAAAPRGTREAREERFGRQVRRRQNKCPPPPTFAGGSRKFSGSRVRVWGSEGRPGGFALDLRTRLGWFNGSCRQPRREESPGVWAGAAARLSAARPGIEPVTSAERSRAPVPRLPVAQWRASRRACLFSAPRRTKNQKKSSNSGFPEH